MASGKLLPSRGARIDMAMIFGCPFEEPVEKWLVDVNLRQNDVHSDGQMTAKQRAAKAQLQTSF